MRPKASPADLEEPAVKRSDGPDKSGAVVSNSLLAYIYIRGKWSPHAAAVNSHHNHVENLKFLPYFCPPHPPLRTPRNGSTAVHVQRVRRPPLYPSGSVCPSDLPRETSGSHSQGSSLPGAGRCGGGDGRWRRGNRELFTLGYREEGGIRLGWSDLCERWSRTGREDRTQRHDHPGNLDELLSEWHPLLNKLPSTDAALWFLPLVHDQRHFFKHHKSQRFCHLCNRRMKYYSAILELTLSVL